MTVKGFISVVALASLLVLSCIPKTPDKPTPPAPTPPVPEDPDPITMITAPGAYGVEGGDVIYDASNHQLSVLEYSGGCTYRLINPGEVSVASVSGLPKVLKAGDSVNFLYRVQQQGHSVVSKQYAMTVMQIKDGKAWLKLDEDTFFVIALW